MCGHPLEYYIVGVLGPKDGFGGEYSLDKPFSPVGALSVVLLLGMLLAGWWIELQ